MTYRRNMKIRDLGKLPEFENDEDEENFMQDLLDSLEVKTWLERGEPENIELEVKQDG